MVDKRRRSKRNRIHRECGATLVEYSILGVFFLFSLFLTIPGLSSAMVATFYVGVQAFGEFCAAPPSQSLLSNNWEENMGGGSHSGHTFIEGTVADQCIWD